MSGEENSMSLVMMGVALVTVFITIIIFGSVNVSRQTKIHDKLCVVYDEQAILSTTLQSSMADLGQKVQTILDEMSTHASTLAAARRSELALHYFNMYIRHKEFTADVVTADVVAQDTTNTTNPNATITKVARPPYSSEIKEALLYADVLVALTVWREMNAPLSEMNALTDETAFQHVLSLPKYTFLKDRLVKTFLEFCTTYETKLVFVSIGSSPRYVLAAPDVI
jgi:hypothetical protein